MCFAYTNLWSRNLDVNKTGSAQTAQQNMERSMLCETEKTERESPESEFS